MICPHCGRCSECGQPKPTPYTPAPYNPWWVYQPTCTTPPWWTYTTTNNTGGDRQT